MLQDRFEWLRRVKGVEREYTALLFAIQHIQAESRHNPGILPDPALQRDFRAAAARLQGTFIIRLFAEFETALREFWTNTRSSTPPSRTRDLLDAVGTRCGVGDERLNAAHVVREYRNALIHFREDEIEEVGIAAARSRLCQFLSFLPVQW